MPLSPAATLARLALIGGITLVAAAAFAYVGGWLSPERLTPDHMIAALAGQGGNPAGHRRNHAKGTCFTGTFEANGAGARLSTAPMLAAGQYPVIGRLAIAVANPDASDLMGRVKSMAFRITAPGGAEWRSGINAMPVFVVSNPQDFYELVRTQDLDPATGKPDQAATGRFIASHPETTAFLKWATTAPWTASYVDETYNSLNAFRFIDPAGDSHLVRWSMVSTLPATPVAPPALAPLGPNFLEVDLMKRLAQGPIAWHLVVTLAAPGDPSNDATKAWPADRQTVDVGTMIVQKALAEADGPCRDINYDPTILPPGIAVSDDPILAARSAAYAKSFDLRTAEEAAYPATQKHAGAAP